MHNLFGRLEAWSESDPEGGRDKRLKGSPKEWGGESIHRLLRIAGSVDEGTGNGGQKV